MRCSPFAGQNIAETDPQTRTPFFRKEEKQLNNLTKALMEELTVEYVKVGPLQIPESVVISWVILAIVTIGSILLTRNLKVDHISKRQAVLEMAYLAGTNFFEGLLGEKGRRYVPYLMTVAIYIAFSNLIGVFGVKPPTKDLDVTAALALMSIILIEGAGIRARGGVTALMKAGFDTLVEAGYQPENAYFECIHEMKLIVDLIFAHGFAGMRYSISNTAEYGDYEIGQRLITEETKKEMKKVLTEIQDGTFARNWLLENQSGCVHFLAKRRIEAGSQLEEVGKDLRSKMSWGTKVEEL